MEQMMNARVPQLLKVLALPAALLLAGAADAVVFPKELRGTWDIGPEACRLPLSADSDTVIRIEARRLVGFENVDTPRRITRLSTGVLAWSVASESNVAPGVSLEDIYVLKGDNLTVTDGETTKTYRRCR
ncbi:TPA: hypothetical protein QDZ88_000676 [Stenotrophomonas maltophilia]|uniref:Uncharacterized protein n=3 Tax=Lysobacteraceae TaxID=32033 RepID=A0A2J0UCN8_STEMA|nr:hypothetical protein B9Y64_06385 [Stenotrophomonas maltophilia]HDS1146346.1 hypothetical protein [Stenotrophomonas maltophilia]HDS1159827.1 hypothetical protein [Stenotrophomonas maltophilia]